MQRQKYLSNVNMRHGRKKNRDDAKEKKRLALLQCRLFAWRKRKINMHARSQRIDDDIKCVTELFASSLRRKSINCTIIQFMSDVTSTRCARTRECATHDGNATHIQPNICKLDAYSIFKWWL